MGTRSTIRFTSKYEYECDSLVTIYQQYDGYISGVGYELANWLLKKKMINGISMEDTMKDSANGIGCLAAQFIHDFKTKIGDLYITFPNAKEDYNYNVIIDDNKTGNLDDITTIVVTQFEEEEPIFIGTPSELLAFREEEEL